MDFLFARDNLFWDFWVIILASAMVIVNGANPSDWGIYSQRHKDIYDIGYIAYVYICCFLR